MFSSGEVLLLLAWMRCSIRGDRMLPGLWRFCMEQQNLRRSPCCAERAVTSTLTNHLEPSAAAHSNQKPSCDHKIKKNSKKLSTFWKGENVYLYTCRLVSHYRRKLNKNLQITNETCSATLGSNYSQIPTFRNSRREKILLNSGSTFPKNGSSNTQRLRSGRTYQATNPNKS